MRLLPMTSHRCLGKIFMSAFIARFTDFINRDIDAPDESKTLAVLIRMSAVIMSFCMLIFAVISAANKSVGAMVLYVVLFALLCYSFYATYNRTVLHALVVLNIVVLLLSCVGTSMYSWDSFFYSYIFFIMLAIFFYTKMSARAQMTAVLSNAAILFFLAVGRHDADGSLGRPTYAAVLNIITFTGLILAVGLSFASKFARADYKLYQYSIQLKKLAGSDPLTGLMNRRNILGVIAETLPRMSTGDDMMSVAIGDIDFFKKVNDSRGHDCGDYVLKELSNLFEGFMDTKGYAARWGGEEFLFVFIHGNADYAYMELEKLRSTIEKMPLKFAEHEFRITMTFGLEEHSIAQDIDDTIKRADEKLYMGKESGRNKVVY
ncbi:MAG TPA: hypothetical protein DCL38_03320 [Lachnospiraceae bacterium]|nr:hypothetical protein [Lachnospiraceae bacterium]